MRYLKKKIQKIHSCIIAPLEPLPVSSELETPCQDPEPKFKGYRTRTKTLQAEKRKPSTTFPSQNKLQKTENNFCTRHQDPMKNIAMNYGKAIANFSVSQLALPYLSDKLEQEGITMAEFKSFVKENKKNIKGISGFRSLLLIQKEDDVKLAGCKRAFQLIAKIFINYFSVNWIIHGKISHKMTYLKFRFKMLRRIQQPEQFTFIKIKGSAQ